MIDKEKDKYKIIKDDTDDDDAIEDAETDYNSGPDFEQVEEEEEECIPFDEVNDVQKAQYRPDFSEMASGAALFQQLAAA